MYHLDYTSVFQFKLKQLDLQVATNLNGRKHFSKKVRNGAEQNIKKEGSQEKATYHCNNVRTPAGAAICLTRNISQPCTYHLLSLFFSSSFFIHAHILSFSTHHIFSAQPAALSCRSYFKGYHMHCATYTVFVFGEGFSRLSKRLVKMFFVFLNGNANGKQ